MRQVSGIWDNLPETIISFLVNYLQRLFERTEGVVFLGVRCVEVRFGNVTIFHCQLIEVFPEEASIYFESAIFDCPRIS